MNSPPAPGPPAAAPTPAATTVMHLRYGVNMADECQAFVAGARRGEVRERLRQIGTAVIRLFLFDKGGPDPVRDWPGFARHVDAVLAVGAVPMITFAKFRPQDDPRSLRRFAGRCADVVWGCLEQWGPERVAGWWWGVWNEPNSNWVGEGLSFDRYRVVYEAVAEPLVALLHPHLAGRPPLIGGPAVDGFQPFWIDWIWRFLQEVDGGLAGFVDWHSYGDWRDRGETGAPADPGAFRALLLSRVPDFEDRTRAVARLIDRRPLLNVCSELNTHSHRLADVRARHNHSVLGGAFYAAALLRLMRGGADAELFWTGCEARGGYALLTGDATATPAYWAKWLVARHVRPGDHLSFPEARRSRPPVEVMVAGDPGRRSVVIVHLADAPASYPLEDLVGDFDNRGVLLTLDEGTAGRIVRSEPGGKVRFDGPGVAVLTDAPAGVDDGGCPGR